MAARNMQRIEINIQEKIVPQVGYLQGSYQDAQSTKHKIVNFDILLTVHLNIFILILTNLMH